MMQGKQRGVALVFVLMLTTVTGMVVLTALNSSATQERMAGNFQKNLNAEWQAERATFESFNRLNAWVRENPDASQDELAEMAGFNPLSGSGGRTFGTVAGWQDDRLALASSGQRYQDAYGSRQARLRLVTKPGGSGRSPFASGVIGCDGVDLTGSADISSYSSKGEPVEQDVVVKTVRDGADITLDGASEIQGDILSTGSIVLGTSKPVAGRLHANKNISITSTAIIEGTVKAVGRVNVTNSAQLQELLQANQDVEITGAAILRGGVQTRGALALTNLVLNEDHGNFYAMGPLSMHNWIFDALTNQRRSRTSVSPYCEGCVVPTLEVPEVPLLPVDDVTDPDSDHYAPLCDPLSIVSEVALVDQIFSLGLPSITMSNGTDKYQFTTLQGEVEQGAFVLNLLPETVSFLGNTRSVYALDSLDFGGSTQLSIEGNITLYVRGDVRFHGASVLRIKGGGSLTLIVGGKVDMSAGLKILDETDHPPQGVNDDGFPALAIYSAYQSAHSSDFGVRFKGGVEDAYAVIYAPEAHIEVGAALRLRGAFVGKTLQISGDGHLYYDQALAQTDPGGGNGQAESPRFVFEGWF